MVSGAQTTTADASVWSVCVCGRRWRRGWGEWNGMSGWRSCSHRSEVLTGSRHTSSEPTQTLPELRRAPLSDNVIACTELSLSFVKEVY